MKKFFVFAGACIAAIASLVSCVKDNGTSASELTGTITIKASIPGGGLTKVAFEEQGGYKGGLKLTWEAGDVITVTDASNASNTQVFTLSDGEGTASGTFTGTALDPALSFNIVYDAAGPAFDYAEQTQATDGSTAHLKYSAALSGVDDYLSLAFSDAWASSHGGTFATSSALRVRADIPMEVSDVHAVILKASAPIFAGGNELRVNITTPGDEEESDVLTVFATLPAGDQAIPAGTKLLVQFQMSDNDHDRYTAYRELGAMTLYSGKVSNISIDCNTSQDILKYANKSADGIGTSSNPYLVGDQHQMVAMAGLMAAGETKYFKLIDDIDLTGVEWIPLNFDGSYNKGINFDGANHTISNLTITNDAQNYPSFCGVVYGTVKDVTFESPSIAAGSFNTGVVGGYIGTGTYDGTCSGITVSNATVSVTVPSGGNKGRNLGIFAGQIGTAASSITDCHVTGVSTATNDTASDASAASNVAGFVGFVGVAASISNCSVSGATVTMNTTKTGCSSGGFVGNVGAAATISGCTAAADVNNPSSYYTGGFVGQVGTAVPASFSYCAFLGGSLSAGRTAKTNNPVGGFVGRMATNAGVSFTNCYVDGAIIDAPTSGRVGGFSGDGGTGATPNTFTSCHVSNTTISAAQHVGGFAGTLYGVANNCYVEYTTITANDQNVGGFTGYLENGTASNCYTSADVIGSSFANIGGFVGQCKVGANVPASVTYCYANGSVSGSAESVGAFIGGVTVDGPAVSKCIAWNATLPFMGSDGGKDVSGITGNYVGTDDTISAQATTLGWDGTIWNLGGSVPTLNY